MRPVAAIFIAAAIFAATSARADLCTDCHQTVTPGIVKEWNISKHSQNNVRCGTCHGDAHTTAKDAAKAEIPTPETCAFCHRERVEQFTAGKHAKAWDSMNAMPTAHWQPMLLMDGMKGCGGCHKIGLKSAATIAALKKDGQGYGFASCDACHTRHAFSVKEAREPEACRTCHMGIDHPQWEMYDSSKHGVRHQLKRAGALPEDAAAPTCQTCHMNGGDHEVRTAWGFLALRLPLPEDKAWAADRTTIFKGLGVLDPAGKPTPRLEALKSVDAFRTTPEAWQAERAKMLAICSQCHSASFARGELEKGDAMIRETDRLMAEGIETVAGLYSALVSQKPEWYAYGYPDALSFHDAPTVVEQKLWRMYLEHRMRAFQGTFHANPDYALWYGWSKMKEDLVEIKTLAEDMREKAKK